MTASVSPPEDRGASESDTQGLKHHHICFMERGLGGASLPFVLMCPRLGSGSGSQVSEL